MGKCDATSQAAFCRLACVAQRVVCGVRGGGGASVCVKEVYACGCPRFSSKEVRQREATLTTYNQVMKKTRKWRGATPGEGRG